MTHPARRTRPIEPLVPKVSLAPLVVSDQPFAPFCVLGRSLGVADASNRPGTLLAQDGPCH